MVSKFVPSLILAVCMIVLVIFSNCSMISLRDEIDSTESQESSHVEILEEDATQKRLSKCAPIVEESVIVNEEEINIDYDIVVSSEDINVIARTLYGECRGVSSDMERAAVVWVILNRVDAGFGDSVIDVVSAEGQFSGYDPNYPILEELAVIAKDVLIRWNMEKLGYIDVGRVLPLEYLWFHGDGEHNYFRDEFRGGNRWYWSLENPYEN